MVSGSGTVTKDDPKFDEEKELTPEDGGREEWGNQCEFFLSCLGYAVGFGNVWRFPYLAYKNGGAVFLIPYVVMLLLAGLPLFFMELALGQYASLGPNIIFPKLVPFLSGLGFAMLVVSTLVAVYYNVILAWTLFYTFASFTTVLPWGNCDNSFNSIGCYTDAENKRCALNGTFFYDKSCMEMDDICALGSTVDLSLETYNTTHCIESDSGNFTSANSFLDRIGASEDYFKNRMLGVTGTSWSAMGSIRWELVGCLFLAWVIVCACMIKGVKSSGKVVYFTALFPYAVLIILFIRGVTLPGAMKGIDFYFLQPNVTKLYELEVWTDAATQIFYSLGSSFGGLITLASYNKFHNNCMRDAIMIAFANCTTSVFAGFVIFSILGFMATILGVEVKDVVDSGSGLAFVVYPEAVTHMPYPPVWSCLFFFMLITLGLDSQFTMVETLTTAIFDQFESLRPKKPLVVCLMCFVLFLFGLTMCLDGGIYMFELFNGYSAGLSVILLALTEIIAVHYIYGFKNFMRNITEGMKIHVPLPLYIYWAATWCFLTPVLLLVIFCLSLYYWAPIGFGGYIFPQPVQGLGWVLCASSVILIPIFSIIMFTKNRIAGKSWRDLFKRDEDFCPASERRLRKTKGAGAKGAAVGVYRYTYDNEGYGEPTAKVYPSVGEANGDRPPPYMTGSHKRTIKEDHSSQSDACDDLIVS